MGEGVREAASLFLTFSVINAAIHQGRHPNLFHCHYSRTKTVHRSFMSWSKTRVFEDV